MDTIKLLAWLAFALIRGVIRAVYCFVMLLCLMAMMVVAGWDDKKG